MVLRIVSFLPPVPPSPPPSPPLPPGFDFALGRNIVFDATFRRPLVGGFQCDGSESNILSCDTNRGRQACTNQFSFFGMAVLCSSE